MPWKWAWGKHCEDCLPFFSCSPDRKGTLSILICLKRLWSIKLLCGLPCCLLSLVSVVEKTCHNYHQKLCLADLMTILLSFGEQIYKTFLGSKYCVSLYAVGKQCKDYWYTKFEITWNKQLCTWEKNSKDSSEWTEAKSWFILGAGYYGKTVFIPSHIPYDGSS